MKEHLLVKMEMRSILRSELEIYASTANMEHYRSDWLRRNFRW
jgi:hypothetical protein